MQVVALIPARYGSTRFSGKPLAQIAGKPMIQWVYELAKQVTEIEEIYVATDDSRISECVQSIGGKSILTSKEHISGSDRLAEAAKIIQLHEDAIIVNIQGDQLFFPPPLIAELITLLQADPEASMVTPIHRFTNLATASNPNVVKTVFDHNHYALYFSRSPIPYYRENEGTPHYFYKHIGIYVYWHNFLQRFVNLPPGIWESVEKLEQLRALEYGYKIKVVETALETLEVDTPEDAERAAIYLESGEKNLFYSAEPK
jgi:3-deoxy-manno-octulosonate cytidylyltransferase (CMP-KDO synthetase)